MNALVLMMSRQHNSHREHFTASSAAELMMAEAVGLVNTLDNWRVVDKIILSTKTPEKKKIFGKGNFQSLTGYYYYYSVCVCLWIWALCKWVCLDITHHLLLEKIKQTAGITAVFVNVERLSPLSEVSLSSFCFCSRAAYRKVLSTNSHISSYRGSWRRPGGSKFLTDTQWSYTFFVAMPGLRRPSYRFLWQRSPC